MRKRKPLINPIDALRGKAPLGKEGRDEAIFELALHIKVLEDVGFADHRTVRSITVILAAAADMAVSLKIAKLEKQADSAAEMWMKTSNEMIALGITDKVESTPRHVRIMRNFFCELHDILPLIPRYIWSYHIGGAAARWDAAMQVK